MSSVKGASARASDPDTFRRPRSRWRAAPRGARRSKIVLAGEQESEREGAAKARQGDAARRRSPRPLRISAVTSCATTSVSVSVWNCTPAAWSSLFSSRKFSMMPLWTTASRSVACGWALVSFGLPWVAHRVCPIPIAPESGASESFSSRLRSFPSGPATVQMAVFQRSDAGRIVSTIFEALQRLDDLGATADRPRMPTIPHISSNNPVPVRPGFNLAGSGRRARASQINSHVRV